MRFFGMATLAAAALALIIGLASFGGTAEAARFLIKGVATGAEENPPVRGDASVYVTFNFDDVTNELTYAATVSGLSADLVTASHIHRAPRGTNGPVIYTLSDKGFTQVSGSIRLTPADVADLRAGNLYFNAHSKENPGGFARMQLVLPAPRPVAPGARIGGVDRRLVRGQVPVRGPQQPGAIVRPPRTGDAGLASERALSPYAGLVVLTVAATGAVAVTRRRS